MNRSSVLLYVDVDRPHRSCGLAGIRARQRHRRVRLVVVERHDAARIASRAEIADRVLRVAVVDAVVALTNRRIAQGRLERLEPLLKKIEGPLEPLDGVARVGLGAYETRLCPA